MDISCRQNLRPVPILLLLAALITLLLLEQTPLLSLRQTLFDTYQQWHRRDRSATPVVVVEIDERSLSTEGQWPWPRSRIAELIKRIAIQEPLAIGLDMVFPEPDQLGPSALLRHYPEQEALKKLPDPDQKLAGTLADFHVVLGVFGTREKTASSPISPPLLQLRGSDHLPPLDQFPFRLGSLPLLAKAASGQGLLNAQPDAARFGQGVVRRVPLLAHVGGETMATLSLEMLRQGLGNAPVQVALEGNAIRTIGAGDYELPTDALGNLRLHFAPMAPERYFSAVDLLSGKLDPGLFKGRFVLLGLTGLGLVDQRLTPLGETVPGVDIHAQVLESLITGQAVVRPVAMPVFEAALLLVLGGLLILAIPRLKPRHTAGLGAGLLFALLLMGALLFRAACWLFDGLSIGMLLTPLFVVLLRDALVILDQQRKQAEKALQESREAAAKVAGELGAARRIQLGLVPDPEERFSTETRCEIAALLEPAREIGGDFYDCFMLDEKRLCLGIGDVTGKGVPASLFMAISKTLCGTMLRQTQGKPGDALTAAAAEINRENPHYLFVTTVLAVVDLETGVIDYACAGHEAPILRRGRDTMRLEVKEVSGPPLCALRDYPFETARAQLQRGDLLCLFTDGINEATDGQQFYGTERVVAQVALLPDGPAPKTCLEAIYNDTETYMAGHPPADDRTLLVFRWWGPQGKPDATTLASS